MKKMIYGLFITSLCFLAIPLWADDVTMPGVATGILSIGAIITNLIFGLCDVTAIILAFMTIIFYRRYRQNSVETTLGKVFWTLALAAVIFIVPFVAKTLSIYQTMEDASQESGQTIE